MKKTILIICLFAGSLFMSSCNDWLSVSPKTETSRDEFFQSESGFKDALIGAYMTLKSNDTYGEALTMSYIENLASFWDVVSTETAHSFTNFNFTEAKCEAAIKAIYGKQYNTIAEANSILEMIDQRQNVFVTKGMYELIKGECLAIRAFCHFDILRMFGPVPGTETQDKILPYVKTVTHDPQIHVTYAEFKEFIQKDLVDAERLLKVSDPWVTGVNASDTYLRSRNIRMNYYAVKAIQARASLWFGEAGAANVAALEVINAQSPVEGPLFRLGSMADMTAEDPDLVLKAEGIMSIYCFDLPKRSEKLFSEGTLSKGRDKTIINRDLYGNTGTDIREANLWMQADVLTGTTGKYTLKKYTIEDTFLVPLMRLSEMYFIAIETSPKAEAQNLWADYAVARNIQLPPLADDKKEFMKQLLKEYRKEFFGEGQMFYRYKLYNTENADYLWLPKKAVINYVLPLPETELIQK